MAGTGDPSAAGRPGALLPLALLLLIGVLWGGFYALIKIGVTGGVGPVNYLFWFTLGSGACLYAVGAARGRRPRLARAHLGYYLRLAAIRFTVGNIILYTAQGKLPVGVMAVVMTFVPIFTYLISLIVRLERLRWLRAAGIVLGFAGVLLMVLPRASLPDRSLAVWVLIALGAPLMHSLAYVLLSERSRPEDVDSLTLSCSTLLTAAVLVLPVAVAAGEFRLLLPPFSVGERALIAHFVLAAINFYAIFELIRIAGPTYMSQANFLSVGFGVAFGIAVFGEAHSPLVWLAILLVLAGVALVSARRA